MTSIKNGAVVWGLLAAAGAASAQWSDNFDSYPAGPLSGQPGWAIWCTGGSDGLVTAGVGRSSPNAFVISPLTDMVQTFSGATSGQWTFIIYTYVPATGGGTGFVNLMNTYCPPTFQNQHWSIATTFNPLTGTVQPWAGPQQALPLITDQWVEHRVEVDLDANMFQEFYNGQLLDEGIWTDNVAPGGALEIKALDLYSDTIIGMRFDDASLDSGGGCPCACDWDTSTGPNVCDIFDFLAFQNRYAVNEACACDYDTSTGPGVCDIFDFLAFQNEYAAGCP